MTARRRRDGAYGPKLSQEHVDYLVKRAVAPDVAKARGYESVADPAEHGFKRQQRRPGLLIPVWSVDGEVSLHQLRPDEPRSDRKKPDKVVKFETPFGESTDIDVPPPVREQVQDASVPLWVTEGVAKADAAAGAGLACVALLGVDCWQKDGEPKSAWKSIPLRERQVFVCFDSDVMTKPQVQRALDDLEQFLLDEGASVQRVLLHPDGGEKVGLDDFLARHSVEALLALADGQEQAEEPKPARRRFRLTDYGNAERLVHFHGDDLRYCHAWGAWLVWDGKVWRKDASDEVMRRAKKTVLAMYAEAPDIEDKDTRDKFLSWVKQSESAARLKAMIGLAESESGMPIAPDQLDADHERLNCLNGIVNLRTGRLEPHDRDRLCTKLAPVDFSPDAKAPKWEKFLRRVLPDEDLREFVQRAVGYSLTASTAEQVLFLLHGNGANGKSTFLEVVRAVLGDYAQNAGPETFLNRKPGGVPNDVARMQGARFVTTIETGDGRRLDEVFVKQVTGGDKISARYMRAEWFEFYPVCKVWLATNHKPQVQGTDDGIWRRLRLVPFDQTIPPAERDSKFPEKLRAELPGVFAWAVAGCHAWQRDGLGEASRVAEATAEYREEMDIVGDFLDACLVDAADGWVDSATLYSTYQDWARDSGYRHVLTSKALGAQLKQRGYERDKRRPTSNRSGTRQWGWSGLALPGYGGPIKVVKNGDK